MQAPRPADSLWSAGGTDVVSARDLMRRRSTFITSSSYPTLKLGGQALVAVYGEPGSGKSTFLCKFLDGVSGNVLLLSVEEGVGDTLLGRLSRLEIHRADFFVGYARTIDELEAVVSKSLPQAVAVDSLSASTLQVGDLKRLAEQYSIPVLFSLHVTKDGAAAGPMTALHESDVVVRVDALRWVVEKSRFSGIINGEV